MSKLHESCYPDGAHYAWVFRCPACKAPHSVTDAWTFNGNVAKPTFSPSVLVYEYDGSHPRCHSFVKDGTIQFLSDCTHEMAGQTVELPEWTGDWSFP